MTRLYKEPIYLLTLCVNLLLGFVCIYSLGKNDAFTLLLLYGSYALVAVIALRAGFLRVHAHSQNARVVALAVKSTLIVLLCGPIVSCLVLLAVESLNLLQAGAVPGIQNIPALFMFATFFATFGILAGLIFTLPFLVLNPLCFFWYRARLRRATLHG